MRARSASVWLLGAAFACSTHGQSFSQSSTPKVIDPPSAPVLATWIELHSGETIAGRWLSLDERAVRARPWGGVVTIIPRGEVAGVFEPAGRRRLQDWSFDDPAEAVPAAWRSLAGRDRDSNGAVHLSPRGAKIRLDLPTPLRRGQWTVRFQERSPAIAQKKSAWRIAFIDGNDHSHRLEPVGEALRWRAPSESKMGSKTRETPTRRRAGWRTLRWVADDERWFVEVDGAILADGEPWSAGLAAIEFASVETSNNAVPNSVSANDETPVLSLDDLQCVTSPDKPTSPSRGAAHEEFVRLGSGDEVHGRITRANAAGAEMVASAAPLRVARSDVQALRLAYRASEWPALRGAWVTVAWEDPSLTLAEREAVSRVARFGRLADQRTPCALEGVLREETKLDVRVEHPLLGSVFLPREWIKRVEPRGALWRKTLDPRWFHLGGAVRPTWPCVEPLGDSFELAFELDPRDLPNDVPKLILEVEPSNEFREALARMVVTLNGRSLAGSLIVHLRGRELALPVPHDALRGGRNVVKLALRPSAMPARAGDLLVGRLALEAPMSTEPAAKTTAPDKGNPSER